MFPKSNRNGATIAVPFPVPLATRANTEIRTSVCVNPGNVIEVVSIDKSLMVAKLPSAVVFGMSNSEQVRFTENGEFIGLNTFSEAPMSSSEGVHEGKLEELEDEAETVVELELDRTVELGNPELDKEAKAVVELELARIVELCNPELDKVAETIVELEFERIVELCNPELDDVTETVVELEFLNPELDEEAKVLVELELNKETELWALELEDVLMVIFVAELAAEVDVWDLGWELEFRNVDFDVCASDFDSEVGLDGLT
jgi:hypothetical protein